MVGGGREVFQRAAAMSGQRFGIARDTSGLQDHLHIVVNRMIDVTFGDAAFRMHELLCRLPDVIPVGSACSGTELLLAVLDTLATL